MDIGIRLDHNPRLRPVSILRLQRQAVLINQNFVEHRNETGFLGGFVVLTRIVMVGVRLRVGIGKRRMLFVVSVMGVSIRITRLDLGMVSRRRIRLMVLLSSLAFPLLFLRRMAVFDELLQLLTRRRNVFLEDEDGLLAIPRLALAVLVLLLFLVVVLVLPLGLLLAFLFLLLFLG